MAGVHDKTTDSGAGVGVPGELQQKQNQKLQTGSVFGKPNQVGKTVEVPHVKLVVQTSGADYADEVVEKDCKQSQLRDSVKVLKLVC